MKYERVTRKAGSEGINAWRRDTHTHTHAYKRERKHWKNRLVAPRRGAWRTRCSLVTVFLGPRSSKERSLKSFWTLAKWFIAKLSSLRADATVLQQPPTSDRLARCCRKSEFRRTKWRSTHFVEEKMRLTLTFKNNAPARRNRSRRKVKKMNRI